MDQIRIVRIQEFDTFDKILSVNQMKENRSTYLLTKRQINLLISTFAFQQSIILSNQVNMLNR